MMGDAASVFQDFISCGILDLSINGDRISKAVIDEAEIDVDTCSCIIDLHRRRNT
jgi:hypothetical protein